MFAKLIAALALASSHAIAAVPVSLATPEREAAAVVAPLSSAVATADSLQLEGPLRRLLGRSRKARGSKKRRGKKPKKSKKKKGSKKPKKSKKKKGSKKPKKSKKKGGSSKKKSRGYKKSPKKKSSKKKKSPPKKSPKPSGGGGGGGSTGGTYRALSTFFSAIGEPFSGCGVPPKMLRDDGGKALPFVALNTNGPFAKGKNCGRWIKINLKENCVGGGNSKFSVCIGNGKYKNDQHSGKTIYGYVQDSCADNNYWCQKDTNHLDISKPYLDSKGMTGGWNGRKVEWQFLKGTPPGYRMGDLKFMFGKDSKWKRDGKGFWVSLIIYNTSDGISKVELNNGGGWQKASMVGGKLGSQWNLPQPSNYRNYGGSRILNVRVTSATGKVYGTYAIKFNCSDTGSCGGNTKASAHRK